MIDGNVRFTYDFAEILSELSRREKHAEIKPDPDIDVFMKVRIEDIMIMGYELI